MSKIYYDPASKGFYLSKYHSKIPKTAFEISKEKYNDLLMEQRRGKVITVLDGVLTTVHPEVSSTRPTVLDIKTLARAKILEVANEDAQRNLLARSLKLLHKGHNDPLTNEENIEIAMIEQVWDRIEAIRGYSNTLEEALADDPSIDIKAGWPSW
jgi:hypothetical protein